METINPCKEEPFDYEDLLNGTIPEVEAGHSYSANGYLYSNEKQSLYSLLMEELYADRKAVKGRGLALQGELQVLKGSGDADPKVIKKMEGDIKRLDTEQMGKKILLNSFYGILALKHFRFFDVNIAESITLNGQAAIRFIAARTSEFLNKLLKTDDVDYVIAIDTDSQYINVEAFVDIFMKKNPNATTADVVDYLDKVGAKLNKFIDKEYLELQKTLNLKEHMMIMDREGIFGHEIGTTGSAGFWTAKKRYVLNCYDMEGVRYTEPKLKIMGLETQRSSTPKIFKTALKAMFREIVEGDNDSFIKKIADFKKVVHEAELNDLAFPTGVNNIAKYQEGEYPIKGAPGHVRAAITHNRLIGQSEEMSNLYPLIRSGEKVLLVSLMDPNPTGEKAFAYVDKFPVETDLEKYVDRDAILEKGFMKPIKSVSEAIGWDVEKTRSLFDFY
jgi:DNA polymerase elongation subunit (family B)